MLERLLDVLRCPVCGGSLQRVGASLRCAERHTFDIARQGYVNLLGGGAHPATGDTADMVQARAEFLGAGHFAPLARALADDAAEVPGDVVLDAGAGTGYYLGAVLDERTRGRGLALDVSKAASRRAARAHERAGAAVWDSWQPLPVRDRSVDLVLDVFAPRNGPEFRRILRPGGAVLVVTPQQAHLAEVAEIAGMLSVDPDKDERLERSLTVHLDLDGRRELAWPMSLWRSDVARLVRMGPSAWHVDATTLASRLATIPEPVQVTAAVVLSRFHRPDREPL